MDFDVARLGSWLQPYLTLAITLAVVGVAHYAVFFVLRTVARRSGSFAAQSVVRRSREPVLLTVLLLAVQLSLPLLPLPERIGAVLGRCAGILLIGAVAWLLIRFTTVGQDIVRRHYDLTAADNLRARQVRTQYQVLRRIVVATVLVVAGASILMTFEAIRQLGAGILASAGIAGIIVGLAAQKTLTTFIAGLQIALTQPIRIDDVVVVEGEWGRVEEVTLTYVVVHIWDHRRLVVPITYFLEKPFQNWTRTSAEILGAVMLHVDHRVPVAAVREHLAQVLDASPLWDRKVQALQVTNVSERTIELRALMSAADSSQAWDLRCAVREQLIAFIRDRYPQSLPRLRAELADTDERRPSDGRQRRAFGG